MSGGQISPPLFFNHLCLHWDIFSKDNLQRGKINAMRLSVMHSQGCERKVWEYKCVGFCFFLFFLREAHTSDLLGV